MAHEKSLTQLGPQTRPKSLKTNHYLDLIRHEGEISKIVYPVVGQHLNVAKYVLEQGAHGIPPIPVRYMCPILGLS